jgi:alpha-ketoglutarate-dependent taurine dioxygenase
MPHGTEDDLQVTPLGETLACEVSGVDFSQPISEATFNKFNEIIAKYGIVMLRKTSFDDDSL